MPTINKPKKPHKKKEGVNKENEKNVYTTQRWKDLRKSLLMVHPICEICLKELATEIHHSPPINTGKTKEERENIAWGITSKLICVCHSCHNQLHNEIRNTKKK